MPFYKDTKTGQTVELPNKPPGDNWIEVADPSGGGDAAYKEGAVKNFGTASNPDWRERSGGAWVPLDDVGVTAADPSQLLGANNYNWSPDNKPGAHGASALWIDPEGRTVTEAAAVARVQKEGSVAPKSPAAGERGYSPPPITPYQQAELGRGYAKDAEDVRQFDVTQARFAEQQAAQTAQQRAELQQRIAEAAAAAAQAQQQIAIAQGTLDFTKSKGEFEMSIGRSAEARATQGQVFSQQAQIATLQFSMAQAQAQQAQWQAQLDSSTDQFNSTMGFNVDRANVEAEANRQQRLQGLAKDIGTLAADPGDRGKYAATVLAAGPGQFGAQDAAVGSTDLRTQQSLTPLQALLGQREGVMGESSTPFKHTPVAARQAAPLNFSGINMPAAAPAGQFPGIPAFVPPPTTGTPGPFTNTAPSIDQGSWSPGTSGQSWLDRPDVPAFLKMADGGMAEGAYISGDSNNGKPNEEINIPLGPGQAYVIPKNKVSPQQWKQLQKMAGGGVFSQGTVFGGNAPDTTQASNFLNTASTNARSGTPWAQGKLPTPVYASTPGFDPVVAQLLASLNAQAGGLDQGSFLRLAALQAPTGLNQGVVRRSR